MKDVFITLITEKIVKVKIFLIVYIRHVKALGFWYNKQSTSQLKKKIVHRGKKL